MMRELKWPLAIAAVVVVARVLLEQAGAPSSVTNAFSVVMLYLLVVPIYFAVKLMRSGTPRPYSTLLKQTALYAALARAMVIPTYWLAYIYSWPQPRFAVDQGGVVGGDMTPFRAFVGLPLVAAAAWVIGSVIIGGGIGSLIIFIGRRAGAGRAGAGSLAK